IGAATAGDAKSGANVAASDCAANSKSLRGRASSFLFWFWMRLNRFLFIRLLLRVGRRAPAFTQESAAPALELAWFQRNAYLNRTIVRRPRRSINVRLNAHQV